MKRIASALIFILILIIPELGRAQSVTGEFNGFVTGPKKTGLSGAIITIRNLKSGEVVSVIAGAGGAYRAPGLRAGAYEIKADIFGFESRTNPEVTLAEGQTKVVDFDLPISTIRDIVTVIGYAPAASLEAAQARESPARDVGEALAETAGVWKLRKGGIATDVVLRGFQSKDLNVLIDGQRIYGACPNHMDPPAFHADFAEVDRVELGKGPFDVKNQGSLGGVINIVTRQPKRGFHAGADLSTGSYGFLNPSATASYGNARFSALGGYSYRLSQPYTDGSGRRFTESVNYLPGSLDSDAFRAGTAWGKFSVVPAANQLIQLSYTRQQADHVLYPYLQMDAVYDNADRFNFGYQVDGLSGFVKTLRFHGYLTQVHHWMTDEYRLSSVGVARAYSMGTMAETRTFGGRFETALPVVNIGIEAYRRGWNTTTLMAGSGYQSQYSIPDVNTDAVGMYAEYQKQFSDQLKLDLGARIDATRSAGDPLKANTSLYFAYNSTRATSAYDTLPSGNARLSYSSPHGFEISAGVGHTERVPEPQERFIALRRMGSDWVGNPALSPSRNTGVDGTFSFRHHGLYLESSIYLNHIQDYITINNQQKVNMVAGIMNSYARSYQNVDARIYGGEFEAGYGLTQRVFLSSNLSYVRGSQDPDPARAIYSTNLPEMPPIRSTTGLRYATGKLSAEIEGVFVGAQRRIDTDLREAPTPGYGIANLKLSTTFRRFVIRLAWNNLLNRSYFEYLSYQRDPFRNGTRVFEPGRNIYLNISYRF